MTETPTARDVLRNAAGGLRARRFYGLMPFRVREVLLVSSPYDAFILEEDGLLSEQLFLEYLDISLPSAPRFTNVATGKEALDVLQRRRVDLILTMSSIGDMGVNTFGRRVRKAHPGRPVVLLALDRLELRQLWNVIDPESFDGAFLWSGDAKILLAIIKYVEDRQNADHDIRKGGVRVIIVVEDSPRYYSSFLGMLYKELMSQSRSLYAEGVNELQRQLYMKSRPKILHATTYEQGMALVQRYRNNLMAIISDVRIPRRGKRDESAGLDFVKNARRYDSELPVLVISAEDRGRASAEQLGAAFADKGSPSILGDIQGFLRENLGFGDFVFRTPDGREVARARDLRDMERHLATVPEDSLVYHAAHNHFSVWLQARSEFDLAERLRPRQVDDFESVEVMREYLLGALRELHRSVERGVVADFARRDFGDNPFARLGRGSLGGKARGIAFLHRCLASRWSQDFHGLQIRLPKTVVLTTDLFDHFIDNNELRSFALAAQDDREIVERFRRGRLPAALRSELEFMVARLKGPLAVRSSSLLEDSMHQRLAGIYHTVMLPNNAVDPRIRLLQLADAIKLVYASTFFRNARAYLDHTGHLMEEEKMAVILQRVVGRASGGRFYPVFSGVAQSYNFYPMGPQRPEDGVVHLGLGLGRQVVEGGRALRVSPRHPGVVPQFADARTMLESSQRRFFAIDLSREFREAGEDLLDTVHPYDLRAAEDDGVLPLVGSVYSPDDQVVRDDLSRPGPRLITFNNVLKHRLIPFAEAIDELMQLVQEGLGSPVEIEFACDFGRLDPRVEGAVEPTLYILQIRPFATRGRSLEVAQAKFSREETFCVSHRTQGHGIVEDIRDVVYVCYDRWDASRNKQVAQEIEKINEVLGDQERPYLLIGPGRWGTADPWLGIPVEWRQICNVRVLVEASPPGYDVDPSQGSHFFQNLSSLGLGYLTVPPGADGHDPSKEQFLDWKWLQEQPLATETDHLCHVQLPEPLTVVLDGRRSQGVIAKPGVVPTD